MPNRAPLAVIQQDLLDGTVSTTRILQKCVLLANSIGSTELRDWARRELDGYGNAGTVPEYRKIKAQIQGDGQSGPTQFRHMSIGANQLPQGAREAGIGNELTLIHPLAELEDMADGDPGTSVSFSLPSGDLIARKMTAELNDPFVGYERVYYTVSRSTLRGVVEGTRTALADLIGEMLRVLPSDDTTPPKELADQAVNYAITGERSTVVINTAMASHGSTSTATATPPKEEESWWTRTRKRGVVITIVALSAGVAGVLNWLHVYPWQ